MLSQVTISREKHPFIANVLTWWLWLVIFTPKTGYILYVSPKTVHSSKNDKNISNSHKWIQLLICIRRMMFILFFLTVGNSVCLLNYISMSSYCSDWNKDCCLEMCDWIDTGQCNAPLPWFIFAVALVGITIIYIFCSFILFDFLAWCYNILGWCCLYHPNIREPRRDFGFDDDVLNFVM